MINYILLFSSILLRSDAMHKLGFFMFFSGPIAAIIGVVVLISGCRKKKTKLIITGIAIILICTIISIYGLLLNFVNAKNFRPM